MGCFSVTCPISHHAIYNERIVGFLVKKEEKSDSLFYPDDWYKPQFFPFRGQCDTYGQIEIDKDDKNRAMYQKYVNTDTDFLDNRDVGEFEWCFILEDVYDYALKIMKASVQKTIEHGKAIDSFGVRDSVVEPENFGELSQEELTAYAKSLGSSLSFSSEYKNSFCSYVSHHSWRNPLSDEQFRMTLNADKEQTFDWYVEEIAKHSALIEFMYLTRRFFMPIINIGTQCEDYEVISKFDGFLARRSRKELHKWDNDDDD